jgi:hypothetical protein
LVREAATQAGEEAKAKRKKAKKAKKKEAERLAAIRRTKDVNLNRLTSISGGGNSDANIVCHECGEKGHRKIDCPKRDPDRPRKRARRDD